MNWLGYLFLIYIISNYVLFIYNARKDTIFRMQPYYVKALGITTGIFTFIPFWLYMKIKGGNNE